jgi:D-alanine-D-alanine ligase
VGIVDKKGEPEVLGTLIQLSQSLNGIRGSQEKKDYQKPEDFCAPLEDSELKVELGKLALQAYNAVQCRDLARVDIRADSSGELFLMEINALVNLDVVSSLNYMAGLKGISYHDLIGQIIDSACERYQMGAH